LSCRIKNILSSLSDEYYLFWALGITAGLYLSDFLNLYNIHLVIAEIIAIVFLLISEIIAVRRLILSHSSLSTGYSGSLKENELYKNCQPGLESILLSGCRKSSKKILVTIVIPFLILFFTGNLGVYIRELKEAKSIFLNIYKNESYTDYSGSNAIVVEGRVSSHPVKSYQNLNFTLYADKICARDNINQPDRCFNAGEFISVNLKNGQPDAIIRDDYLRLNGYLKGNVSKDSDSGRFRGDGIILLADWKDTGRVECAGIVYKLFIFRSRLYNCLKNAFYIYLDYKSASIAESLILGNRNNIPEYVEESFKKCGLYHLFAISGLHISFFVSLIYLILRRIRKSIIVFWAVIIFLVIYNFLVAERASILRASTAAVFMLFARNWGREYNRKIILYLSYIIIIIYNPYFFYDLGFWMTYISMSALVFIYPVILRLAQSFYILKRGISGFFINIILITVSVQAALFPLLACFFKEVSLISPVTGFFLIPLFYVLLFVLIVSFFAVLIWPPLGGVILKSGGGFFEFILKAVNFFGKSDFCIINFDSFTVKNAVVYYIVFTVILIFIYSALDRAEIRKGNF
jgi:ComEC/Rec2-related protein